MSYRHRICIIIAIICGSFASIAHAGDNALRLGTTSSVYNSGLLDLLLDAFKRESGISVHAAIQGSGQTLKSARLGDLDVTITHSPDDEDAFITQGYADKKHLIMSNAFAIAAPHNDPAQIAAHAHVRDAFRAIYQQQAHFISRGDKSGTHHKEMQIWQQNALMPDSKTKSWYWETGVGMGKSLLVAYEKQAYILVDKGTWLNYQQKLPHFRLYHFQDEILYNPYHIMAVSAEKHPHLRHELAGKFIAFLTGANGQHIIAHYRINDVQLFDIQY